MADAVEIRYHGVREFAYANRRLADNIADEAEDRFRDVAGRVAAQAAGRVPHRSGRLAGAVRAEDVDAGGSVGVSKTEVPYAGWIEFGGTRGRPYVDGGRYLYPVATEATPMLVEAAHDAATDEIRRMHWPSPRR